jgi:hypothetical protein
MFLAHKYLASSAHVTIEEPAETQASVRAKRPLLLNECNGNWNGLKIDQKTKYTFSWISDQFLSGSWMQRDRQI